jgi:nucleoside-diphosphate-sugar epimerase
MTGRLASKRVLITGGLGFIGSNLAHALVERGAQVTLLDAMHPAHGANLTNIQGIRDRVRINFAALREDDSLRYLVRDQDAIFSLAGQVSHWRSMADPLTDLEINCRSQLALLERCRQDSPTARIVFASTRQLYGRPQSLPVTEDHPCAPVDINGIHNLAAEMYYTLYHRVYGLPTVSLRLTNTYGPRQDVRSRDKGFVGVFLGKALRGEPLELFGTGEQRRDFNYVDDVVEALLLAATAAEVVGGVFNLGGLRAYSLREFAETLHDLTGCTFRTVPFPEAQQAIDIGDYWGDFSRFATATGWRPRVDLREGLEQTVAFFRRHRDEYL